ncbi:MAG TPA: gliding motility-associated C-terminal domain-containing protein [Cyclobacteriaceae bacterium]
MKKLVLIFVFLGMLYPATASHIVGGELSLVHVAGNPYTYRFELILYYDSKNGQTGGDPNIFIRIFRKSNHQPVNGTQLIQLTAQGIINPQFGAIGTPVEYFQPVCSDGSMETNRVFYQSNVITLSSTVYNDPAGYYVVWERCCRNYNITNIYTEDPNNGGVYSRIAGQIFYLEFPAVVKNGVPFINSSPQLFPPLRDYACPNRKYFVDFKGTDPDGDSLVYSIVTPLNSVERINALPPGNIPNPGPYDSVQWKPGFSFNNIMHGNPDLKISEDGLLTVTPSPLSRGLFVFAVRCEEFRNGVKIGEVRRDFQMLVQDACPDAEPPAIVGRELDDVTFGTTGALNVVFNTFVTDDQRCFEVSVSDPDALKFDDGFEEYIRIEAIPIGFKKDISGILPVVRNTTITNGGTAVFRICLPECPYVLSGVYQIGIIAFDNACTLPLSDTLIVTVHQTPPPNQAPQFSTVSEIVESVPEAGTKQWPIHVSDNDGDLINYRLVAVGFQLENFGMTFTEPQSGQSGSPLSKTLAWNPKCDVFDFTNKSNFKLYFIVDDVDKCLLKNTDTTYFDLNVIDFSQITPPVINNSIESFADSLTVTAQVYGNPLIVDVTGMDVDNTPIVLRAEGIGFDAFAYGVSFPEVLGQGSVASQFRWDLQCDSINLEKRDSFEFMLVVVDSLNKCGFYKADTLHLLVQVEPPEEKEFVPPNVFSPNNDEKNAFFAMVEYDEDTGEFESILPEDNCFGEFMNIRIYDRWGKEVFESTDRDFKWYGEGMPPGVYYYYLRYTNRGYKGIVSIRL